MKCRNYNEKLFMVLSSPSYSKESVSHFAFHSLRCKQDIKTTQYLATAISTRSTQSCMVWYVLPTLMDLL